MKDNWQSRFHETASEIMHLVLPLLIVWLVVDTMADWKLHKLFVLLTAICWLVLDSFWRRKARGTPSAAVIARIPWWRWTWLVLQREGLYYLPLSSVPVLGLRIIPEQIAWVGLAMCVVGIGFAIWSRHTLAGSWNISATALGENQTLIQSGPYAIVRHPIYFGMLLGALGTALVVGELRAFFNFMAMISEGWGKLNQEEAIFRKQFPDKYPSYQHRVKKLIPGVL
jgi:protein-S-isoprenylcysteine O-methyltransferase Ste14